MPLVRSERHPNTIGADPALGDSTAVVAIDHAKLTELSGGVGMAGHSFDGIDEAGATIRMRAIAIEIRIGHDDSRFDLSEFDIELPQPGILGLKKFDFRK